MHRFFLVEPGMCSPARRRKPLGSNTRPTKAVKCHRSKQNFKKMYVCPGQGYYLDNRS